LTSDVGPPACKTSDPVMRFNVNVTKGAGGGGGGGSSPDICTHLQMQLENSS